MDNVPCSFYIRTMNNSAIADNFSLLARLMDIHGENSFKSKSYATAAFTIDKLPVELNQLPEEIEPFIKNKLVELNGQLEKVKPPY